MTVKLYAFTCGHLTIPKAFMLSGSKGTIRVPVPAYVMIHAKGIALFDSGLHLATHENPVNHVGETMAKYHEFEVGAGDDIASQLELIEVEPDSVTHVINSHLHFDHCGGNALLPNADILIQERELEAARRPDGELHGYLRDEFDTGQCFQLTNGEHDVFGDGSVMCFPTYGHTPGHQSLRVQTSTGGEYVLCGDACYLRESLEKLHLPGIIADPDAAMQSFHQFRRLQEAGAKIMFGHDPTEWLGVPKAPTRLG